MATKIETTNSGPSAVVSVRIESPGSEPTISVKFEETGAFEGEGASRVWKDRPDLKKQLVTFLTKDGPVEMTATVPDADAVEMAAAHKVIVECALNAVTLPAFDKGRKSKTVLQADLVRVVEVWADAKKRVFPAAATATQPVPGKVMGDDGKVKAA